MKAFLPRDTVTIDHLNERAMKIMSSNSVRGKVSTVCVRSFLFLMRTNQLSKIEWHSIDDCIKQLIKRTLGLPPTAANEYLYGSRDDGLLGIPLAADDTNIAHINGGFILLPSKDYIIQDLAWEELGDDANFKYKSTREQNKPDFLNSVHHASERAGNRHSSQRTRAMQACNRLKISWNITENKDVEFSVGYEDVGV